jgi:hypothetical protein
MMKISYFVVAALASFCIGSVAIAEDKPNPGKPEKCLK